jgi:hypothetical protein
LYFVENQLNQYQLLAAVSEGLRPDVRVDTTKIPEGILHLLRRMWDKIPENRPSIDKVIEILDRLNEEIGSIDELETRSSAFSFISSVSSFLTLSTERTRPSILLNQDIELSNTLKESLL